MQQKRGRGTAAHLAEALQGMSSGRQAQVDLSRVDSDLVLVAGSTDQKFVRLAESMTRSAHGVQTTASPGSTNGILVSPGKDPHKEGVSHKHHATCFVVQNCGHAVHVERSEAVVHLLQSLLDKAVGV